jgi:hypothetical protein
LVYHWFDQLDQSDYTHQTQMLIGGGIASAFAQVSSKIHPTQTSQEKIR